MDIRLARGSSGIDAGRTIRDSLDIPSIFVTAHEDAATIGQTMAARPLGFVTKPYTSRGNRGCPCRSPQQPSWPLLTLDKPLDIIAER